MIQFHIAAMSFDTYILVWYRGFGQNPRYRALNPSRGPLSQTWAFTPYLTILSLLLLHDAINGDPCSQSPHLLLSIHPQAPLSPPRSSLSLNAPFKRLRFHCRPCAALEALETKEEEPVVEKERVGVVVKTMEKPRLVLKFVWMEKNIGLALDQVIPGYGTIPLSPYYFWPRKDAWEELKSLLESKAWISQKRMIILLNQATDIINLWQQSGGAL